MPLRLLNCCAGCGRSRLSTKTRASRSPSASGWSRATAGCGGGTGSSPIGAGAAAAERLIRANRLAALAARIARPESRRSKPRRRSATAHLAQMERCRTAAEEARTAALAAERDAREAARAIDAAAAALERIEAQRSSLVQRQADLDPVLDAPREALTAAERVAFGLPDPAALEHEVEGSRTSGRDRRIGCRRQARGGRDQGARDRRRPRTARALPHASSREWRKRQADAEQRLHSAVERQTAAGGRTGRPVEGAGRARRQIGELEQANDQSQVRIGEAAAAEREAEEAVAAAAQAMSAANELSADTRERRAAAAARAEAQQARSAEFARAGVDKFEVVPQRLPEKLGFDSEEPRNADEEAAALERLTAERERIGPVNLVAEQELAELDAARTKGAEEAEELTQAINRLRGSIGNLNREGRVRLLEAYEKVDGHFRRLFTTLFEGGQAHLELVESDDPLEAGLEIMAQPPGKRLSTLTLLSGGEQALTAVALIFAIFLTNPAPICVLDEVDAPLDDANVERFCELLKDDSGDRHSIPDRYPQCRDDEPHGPALRRHHDRKGRQPAGIGRLGRCGDPARSRMTSAIANDFQ